MRIDGDDLYRELRHVTGRLPVFALAVAIGIAAASFVPQLPEAVRTAVGLVSGTGVAGLRGQEGATGAEQRKRDAPSDDEQSGIIKLANDQIEAVGIELAPVQDGTLARRVVVPGTIVLQPDRIARVSVRLSGTVAELRKGLGDTVAKGEVMAILESREVATAKSEYLAARLNSDLQRELYDREKILWDRRVSSEQNLLRSRGATAQARMNFDIARQKLFALGVTETEITALPDEPEPKLRRQEVLAPISGRVVERKVVVGTVVGRDNLETEIFSIADLDRVWVELAVGPNDLPIVREGRTVSVAAHGLAYRAIGKIVFISPMVDRETHSARVVAEIANPDGNWRPGSLVHCTVAIEEHSAPLTVPASAIQTVGRSQVVFVRTTEGFEKRPITLGQGDDRISEVLAGVHAGETIAVTNTFALKAEFLKSLAED
jgi:cobalt-zinc-cadmium efflux system membrane fusion protein